MELPTHHPPQVVRLIRTGGLVLIAVVVLFVGVMKIGVYMFGWQNNWVKRIVRVVPLPAVTMNWQVVTYSDFLVEYQALRQYNEVVANETNGTFVRQSDADLAKTTIRKLIRDRATIRLLKSYGVALTRSDIDRAFSTQVSQSGNQQATAQAIRELYDWTTEEYKDHVVASAVAREKLREFLAFNRPYNQAAEKQGTEVLKLVQDGKESFEELAKRYSEDAYAVNGGDLGFIGRGEQDEVIEQAAFGLGIGESSELLHTKFGFHIIQVVEKQGTGEDEKVRIRQIFIAGPSVDEAITGELRKMKIGIWVKGWRWDAKAAEVAAS